MTHHQTQEPSLEISGTEKFVTSMYLKAVEARIAKWNKRCTLTEFCGGDTTLAEQVVHELKETHKIKKPTIIYCRFSDSFILVKPEGDTLQTTVYRESDKNSSSRVESLDIDAILNRGQRSLVTQERGLDFEGDDASLGVYFDIWHGPKINGLPYRNDAGRLFMPKGMSVIFTFQTY